MKTELLQIAKEMRERRVGHGKWSSPTLEKWAARIEAAVNAAPTTKAPHGKEEMLRRLHCVRDAVQSLPALKDMADTVQWAIDDICWSNEDWLKVCNVFAEGHMDPDELVDKIKQLQNPTPVAPALLSRIDHMLDVHGYLPHYAAPTITEAINLLLRIIDGYQKQGTKRLDQLTELARSLVYPHQDLSRELAEAVSAYLTADSHFRHGQSIEAPDLRDRKRDRNVARMALNGVLKRIK